MEEGFSHGSAPIILGRPFLKTAQTKIDVHIGTCLWSSMILWCVLIFWMSWNIPLRIIWFSTLISLMMLLMDIFLISTLCIAWNMYMCLNCLNLHALVLISIHIVILILILILILQWKYICIWLLCWGIGCGTHFSLPSGSWYPASTQHSRNKTSNGQPQICLFGGWAKTICDNIYLTHCWAKVEVVASAQEAQEGHWMDVTWHS